MPKQTHILIYDLLGPRLIPDTVSTRSLLSRIACLWDVWRESRAKSDLSPLSEALDLLYLLMEEGESPKDVDMRLVEWPVFFYPEF